MHFHFCDKNGVYKAIKLRTLAGATKPSGVWHMPLNTERYMLLLGGEIGDAGPMALAGSIEAQLHPWCKSTAEQFIKIYKITNKKEKR